MARKKKTADEPEAVTPPVVDPATVDAAVQAVKDGFDAKLDAAPVVESQEAPALAEGEAVLAQSLGDDTPAAEAPATPEASADPDAAMQAEEEELLVERQDGEPILCFECNTDALLVERRDAVHAEYARYMDPAQCDGRPPVHLRAKKTDLDLQFERRAACPTGGHGL